MDPKYQFVQRTTWTDPREGGRSYAWAKGQVVAAADFPPDCDLMVDLIAAEVLRPYPPPKKGG